MSFGFCVRCGACRDAEGNWATPPNAAGDSLPAAPGNAAILAEIRSIGDSVKTIKNILVFFFVLWMFGVVVALVATLAG